MAETKGRLYKRDTATRTLEEFVERIESYWPSAKHIEKYPIDIKEIIVFGSYAKGADKVHDLDIFISIDFDRDKMDEYADGRSFEGNVIEATVHMRENFGKFLKRDSRLISLHVDEFSYPGEREIAVSDTHYCIYKDGEFLYDAIEALKAL